MNLTGKVDKPQVAYCSVCSTWRISEVMELPRFDFPKSSGLKHLGSSISAKGASINDVTP